MNKYENGKIYKIEAINGDEGDIYIGSTSQKLLCNRMAKHRQDYKRYNINKNIRVRSYDIFDKYGIENCVITLLEVVNCQCNDELKARERYYIQSSKCVNKNIPLRSAVEYYQDNKESVDDYRKEWRANNKEKIKLHNTSFWEQFKESPDKRKYYSKDARKIYYQTTKNKDSETFVCECGSECWTSAKNRHFKSKKHQDYLMSQSK